MIDIWDTARTKYGLELEIGYIRKIPVRSSQVLAKTLLCAGVVFSSINLYLYPLFLCARSLIADLGLAFWSCGDHFLIFNKCDILVQLFPNLFKLAPTCSNLSKLIQTCLNLFKLVQTCPNFFPIVQTSSNLTKLVLI